MGLMIEIADQGRTVPTANRKCAKKSDIDLRYVFQGLLLPTSEMNSTVQRQGL